MSPHELLRSQLGLTRGDLTVAIFLSFTAIVGFFYRSFVEDPKTRKERVGMSHLIVAADSIVKAQRSAGLLELYAEDSLQRWIPLSDREVLEEGTDGEGRVELTLDDVAPINPNTAPPEILELLPGVGEKTALKIVAARPFSSVEDLLRVHGIGPKKLEKMREFLIVPLPTGQPSTKKKDSAEVKKLLNNAAKPDSLKVKGSAKKDSVRAEGRAIPPDSAKNSSDSGSGS